MAVIVILRNEFNFSDFHEKMNEMDSYHPIGCHFNFEISDVIYPLINLRKMKFISHDYICKVLYSIEF